MDNASPPDKAETVARAAFDKKAEDIVVMDMTGRSAFCEFFVVMNAPSSARVKAIADHIEQSMEDEGLRLLHKEGYREALWVLMDYGSVIAHIFQDPLRHFYDLEHLWGDAPKRHYAP